jgi:hypothetical protein
MGIEQNRAALVDKPSCDIAVSVDSPVSEKRPMCALRLHSVQVCFRNDHLFLVGGGPFDDLSRRVADKALAPEFDAIAAIRGFVTDAVRHRNVAAICHGVAALDRLP